jgi:hypothetical protein
MTVSRRRAGIRITDRHLERAAMSILIAFVAALFITLATGSGSSTAAGRIGGDYPAFYGAGTIVLDGDSAHLYDPDRQAQAQRDLFGQEHDGFLYFAYPPAVAAAYAPLALLPYRLSYALHTLLMIGALVLALRVLRPIVPILARRFWVSAVLAAAFFPMFRAIGGGQNTALTVLLIALAWRAAHDGHDVRAGVFIGLLLFKPQLAVLFLLLLLVTRRWRAIGGAAGVGVAWWVAGVPLLGVGWVRPWLDRAQWFSAMDARVNGKNSVSFLGATQSAFGEHATIPLLGAALLSGITVLLVVRTWRRAGPHDLAAPMAVACAGGVLAVPHVMFYDAGLLVITGIGVLASDDRRARAVLGVIGAAGVAHVLTGVLPFNPLVIASAAAFVLALATAEAHADATRPRPERRPVDPDAPALSIVVPAYNEAARLAVTLDEVVAFAATRPEPVEVVVVDDGSTDATAAIASSYADRLPGLRVISHEHNQGKGAAVRTGMLAATGRWRLFTDADGSTPIDEVDHLLAEAGATGADVAIASIAVDGATISNAQSFGRVALGTLGNLLVRLTVLPGIRDTQRGFKLFSAQSAEDAFAGARADGWGFDVEILAAARARGYRITEVGVRWAHREGGALRARAYLDTLVEVGRLTVHSR